ncbi:MAG: hypothetical protein AAF203_04840, partial [Pseudomonadota bacterium]
SLELKKVTCEAIEKSFLVPDHQSSHSSVVGFSCDSDFVKGYSGLALFEKTIQGWSLAAINSQIRDVKKAEQEQVLVSNFIVSSSTGCMEAFIDRDKEDCQFIASDDQYLKAREQNFVSSLEQLKSNIQMELTVGALSAGALQWMATTETTEVLSHYGDFFQKRREKENPFLSESKRDTLTATFVPLMIKCIRIEPGHESKVQSGLEIPIVATEVRRTDSHRILFEHRVQKVKMKAIPQGDFFRLQAETPVAEYQPSTERLMGDQFDHQLVNIPICP